MAITIRPMATDIHSFEQLNALTQINNVPLQVIEQRARPGSWSQGGFINQQERLVGVLKNDWATVASLGLRHSEIGEKLQYIIRSSMRSYGGRGHAGEQNTISIVSDFHQGQKYPFAASSKCSFIE